MGTGPSQVCLSVKLWQLDETGEGRGAVWPAAACAPGLCRLTGPGRLLLQQACGRQGPRWLPGPAYWRKTKNKMVLMQGAKGYAGGWCGGGVGVGVLGGGG